MAWTSPKTYVYGELESASDGNTYIRDNIQYLYDNAGGGGQARKSLPISSCYLPDDSTGSAAAQVQRRTSSDATDPQLFWTEALFDDTTNEHIYFEFAMPDNYASAPVVDVWYKMASAAVNEVIFGAAIHAASDGDAADMDAEALGTTNDSGATTVPGTAGYPDVCSITMSNIDSLAANDRVILEVHRHADHADDDAAGDAEVFLVVLRWTST